MLPSLTGEDDRRLTGSVSRLSLEEESDREKVREMASLQGNDPYELLVFPLFLKEAFMALHELPLDWQKYLRENYSNSDFLKRMLVFSRASLDDGFLSEDDIKIETDLIETIKPGKKAEESFYPNLITVLSTPFIWNNTRVQVALNAIWDLIDHDQIRGYIKNDDTSSIVALNIVFLEKWREKKLYDFCLSGLLRKNVTLGILEHEKLSLLPFESRGLSAYSPIAQGYMYFQEAVRRRYGLEGRLRDLKQAHEYYQRSLEGIRSHPGMLMDAADFYKTLLRNETSVLGIFSMVALNKDMDPKEEIILSFLEMCWAGKKIDHIPAILEMVHYIEKHPELPALRVENDLGDFLKRSQKDQLISLYETLFTLTEKKQYDERLKELRSLEERA